MFGIGGGEVLVIAIVAVIVFGTEDLPKNMRKFMKAWNNFRGVANDLQRGWFDIRDQVTRDIMTDVPEKQLPSEKTLTSDSSLTSSNNDAKPELSSDASPSGLNPSEDCEKSELPTPRQAQGVLAQGELEESRERDDTSVTSSAVPDKST